jgi:Holliday junction resolvase
MVIEPIRATELRPTPKELAGRNAEDRFQSWMDSHSIKWYRIDQGQDTMALAFKGAVTRPDYTLRFGIIHATIAVDVKSRFYDKDYENFIVNENEIQRLKEFQDQFGDQVWLALSTDAIQYNTWYWITVEKVALECPVRTSSVKGNRFYPIRIDQCKTVGLHDGLDRILS